MLDSAPLASEGKNLVNFEEALRVVDELVFAKAGRHLDDAEKTVVEAAWEDKDYKEIAEKSPYTAERLQRDVGRKLWILLTGILGNGQKVTKKRLRGILEQRMSTPGSSFPYGSEGISKGGDDISDMSQLSRSNTLSHVIGGQPPDVSRFYGRSTELATLKKAIVENCCVAIIGVAGIGKSTLAAKLIEVVHAEPRFGFDCFIWKSISHAPPLSELVSSLLKLLVEPPELNLLENTEGQVSSLIEVLQTRRCLLVLDAAEAVLQGDRNTSLNPYGEQYADYGAFIRRVVEEKHQSCLVLTSQEPFNDINKLYRSRRASCCSLKVEGLDLEAAMKILQAEGLTDEPKWEKLLESYLGNPAAIEQAASKIKSFFNGEVANFLNYKTTLAYEIFREALAQQFCSPGRLTYLEKQIMLYLAERIAEFPSRSILFSKLIYELNLLPKKTVSLPGLIEALTALNERSLIELAKDKETGELFISLKSIVRRYVLQDSEELVGDFTQAFG